MVQAVNCRPFAAEAQVRAKPRPVRVEFVVDKVALRHFFLPVLRSPLCDIIPPIIHLSNESVRK